MSDNNFIIPKDQYVAFDALTLKEQIKNRLKQGGVFTDQDYEGSNISTIIDIIAYTFNTLMFYLNKTSTESLFSDAQIYENMNRVVKLLDYKPIGNQTSTLSFQASASDTLSTGLYLIPRYSFLNANGVFYSFNEDIVISKTLANQAEALTNFSNQKLLFQGRYTEYPLYTAEGNENEVVYLLPGDNVIIDHFNIDVYVKPENEKWEKWTRSTSLYLETGTDKRYEVRYNEDKHYEIKFGNNINGKKLNTGDSVAIYFLESTGADGQVGVGALQSAKMYKFETNQLNGTNGILPDVIFDYTNTLISNDDIQKISFDNKSNSTYYNDEETVDEIRQNAPGVFRSQYRVVTEADHINYIKTNFSQLIHDVQVANNWTYVSQYLKYLNSVGLTNPNRDSRALYNQVTFGDACNFNNVYAFIVPKSINETFNFSYLTPSQKEYILYDLKSKKVLTSELIIMDPVYVTVAPLIPIEGVASALSDIDNSKIVIIKDENTKRNDIAIKSDVVNVFKNYFDKTAVNLGQVIDINVLTKNILDISGVKTFYTRRTDDTSVSYEGLALAVWNPIYTNDLQTTTKNLPLQFFKIPYLYNYQTFDKYIEVQADVRIYETIEY